MIACCVICLRTYSLSHVLVNQACIIYTHFHVLPSAIIITLLNNFLSIELRLHNVFDPELSTQSNFIRKRSSLIRDISQAKDFKFCEHAHTNAMKFWIVYSKNTFNILLPLFWLQRFRFVDFCIHNNLLMKYGTKGANLTPLVFPLFQGSWWNIYFKTIMRYFFILATSSFDVLRIEIVLWMYHTQSTNVRNTKRPTKDFINLL